MHSTSSLSKHQAQSPSPQKGEKVQKKKAGDDSHNDGNNQNNDMEMACKYDMSKQSDESN